MSQKRVDIGTLLDKGLGTKEVSLDFKRRPTLIEYRNMSLDCTIYQDNKIILSIIFDFETTFLIVS